MQLEFAERKKGRFHYQLTYAEHEELGCGAFATVKRCVDRRDNQSYAVKKISLLKLGMERFPTGRQPTDAKERDAYQRKKDQFKRQSANILQEIKVLAECTHPSLIAFHESWFNEANSSFYIAMELAGGPELFERIVGGPNGDGQPAQVVVASPDGAGSARRGARGGEEEGRGNRTPRW